MGKLIYTKENIGKIFDFVLQSTINLHDEPTPYFQIIDDQSQKFIIPATPYLTYQLTPGQQIKCRLDRINCSGEIFFEPLHPFYREKEYYQFKPVEKKTIINALELEEEIAIVHDIFETEQWIRHAKGVDENQPETEAYVQQIKKGRLHLTPSADSNNGMKTGEWYRFKISGVKQTERMGQAFIILDLWGNQHAIPSESYENYGLVVGGNFNGFIEKFSTKGFFYIEPEHPVYSFGMIYPFRVLDRIEEQDKFYLFVEDSFKEVIKVEVPPSFGNQKVVKAQVRTIRKGKPELIYIPDNSSNKENF